VTALRAHRIRQQAERAAAGARWQETGYVFTTRYGAPVAPDRLTRIFRRLVAGSGLPPVTLHGLRHGAATLALAAGADLKVVQDQVGHSTITLTADTYTKRRHRVSPSCRREGCAAHPAGRQTPTRRPKTPPVIRPSAGHHRRLTITAALLPHSLDRRHGQRSPGASEPGFRHAMKRENAPDGLRKYARRRSSSRLGPTRDPPWPHQPQPRSRQGGKRPGQDGCAARDSNPEPAD